MSKTIWTNHGFRTEALELFKQGLAAGGHRLIHSAKSSASVLAAGASDPTLEGADIAFGQPDIGDVKRLGVIEGHGPPTFPDHLREGALSALSRSMDQNNGRVFQGITHNLLCPSPEKFRHR